MYTELDGLKYGFFDYFNTGIIFCDVLYECMLNSTEKLQINKFLSYLKRVPGGGGGALFSVNLIKFNSELSQI